MSSKEILLGECAKTDTMEKGTDREPVHELSLLRELETGECRLGIDGWNHTITIKRADSGEIVFHASIEEYERLLAEREALGEPILNKKSRAKIARIL